MLFGVRPVKLELNDAVPVCAPSVEVAITVVRVADVPYAKPDCVAFAPPVTVMLPFKVAVEVATGEAVEVVTVGAQALVVNVASDPYPVPWELVA